MNFLQLNSIQPRSAFVTRTTVPSCMATVRVSVAARATPSSCSRCQRLGCDSSSRRKPWLWTHVEGSTVSSQSKIRIVSSAVKPCLVCGVPFCSPGMVLPSLAATSCGGTGTGGEGSLNESIGKGAGGVAWTIAPGGGLFSSVSVSDSGSLTHAPPWNGASARRPHSPSLAHDCGVPRHGYVVLPVDSVLQLSSISGAIASPFGQTGFSRWISCGEALSDKTCPSCTPFHAFTLGGCANQSG
mmetsp:Transcript_58834/g.164297  ORF Transcript_58834/g.164297 Transcript_58834/m.164297 type:complete len:242 (+) Transcript_58834:536-1261(+)